VSGTLTDIWKGDRERSLPMSIFGMTSVIGIALGPFVGGATQTHLSWRWIYWVCSRRLGRSRAVANENHLLSP
jgi:MFS family permease